MTRQVPIDPVRGVLTRSTSLTLSEVASPAGWCRPCGRVHGPLQECVWCGGPADPVAGAYLDRLYPGRTTCRGCGRLQVGCTCPGRETVGSRQMAPAHRIPAPRLPVLRDVAPASETELAGAWGDR